TEATPTPRATQQSHFVLGSKAPPWKASLLNGREVGTHTFKGKSTAVLFWADWCPPCVGEPLEIFQERWRKLDDRMNLISVASSVSETMVEEFMREEGYRFPVVVDTNREITLLWKVSGLPTLVLLDESGVVVRSIRGSVVPALKALPGIR
ncbi:MAG: TlpA family protein disulfide reductase, partial [Acidimicrobiia bacterium]